MALKIGVNIFNPIRHVPKDKANNSSWIWEKISLNIFKQPVIECNIFLIYKKGKYKSNIYTFSMFHCIQVVPSLYPTPYILQFFFITAADFSFFRLYYLLKICRFPDKSCIFKLAASKCPTRLWPATSHDFTLCPSTENFHSRTSHAKSRRWVVSWFQGNSTGNSQ